MNRRDARPWSSACRSRRHGEQPRPDVAGTGIQLAADSWEIKEAVSEIEIPHTVAEAFRRRAAMLDDNQRTLLEVLAVCGRPTAADVLANGAKLDSETFHSALTQLVERRIAYEVPGPGLLFRLSHDRLREIIYGDMDARARANLHLTMARSMEAIFARELEEHVFSRDDVADEAKRFVRIRLDLADPPVPVEELKQQYRVFGAPAVVLIDSAGNVRYDLTVTEGTIAAEEFLRRLRQVK